MPRIVAVLLIHALIGEGDRPDCQVRPPTILPMAAPLFSGQALAPLNGADRRAPWPEKRSWASWSDLHSASELSRLPAEDPLSPGYGAAIMIGPEEAEVLKEAADLRIAATVLRRIADTNFQEELIGLLRTRYDIPPFWMNGDIENRVRNGTIYHQLAPICLPLLRLRAAGRSLAEYSVRLTEKDQNALAEREALYNRLRVALWDSPSNNSSFFRDYEKWGLDEFLAEVLADKWRKRDLTFRSEHMGAGAGQEGYTVAIALHGALRNLYDILRRRDEIQDSFEVWRSRWTIHIGVYDRSLGNLLQVMDGLYDRSKIKKLQRVLHAPVIDDEDNGVVRMGEILRSWVHPVLLDVTEPLELQLIPLHQADATFALSVMMHLYDLQDKMHLYERLIAARRPQAPHLFVFNAYSGHNYMHVRYAPDGQWFTGGGTGYAELMGIVAGQSPDEAISAALALGLMPMPALRALRLWIPRRPWMAEAIRWMLSQEGLDVEEENLVRSDDSASWFPPILSDIGDLEQVTARFLISADNRTRPYHWPLEVVIAQAGHRRIEYFLDFLVQFKHQPFVQVPPGLEETANRIALASWSELREWLREFMRVGNWVHPDLESWMSIMGWSPRDLHYTLACVFGEREGARHRGGELQLVIGRILNLWWSDPRGRSACLPAAA